MATIIGTGGNDTLDGSTENDSLDGAAGNDTLRGLAGNDTVSGNVGDDSLLGDAGDDWLSGGDGIDTLRGGASFDILEGGAGADILDGGEGVSDYASFYSSPGPVLVDIARGTANDGYGSVDTLIGIEHVTDSAFNDTIIGDGQENLIFMQAGDDRIDGAGGLDGIAFWSANGPMRVDLAAGTASGGGLGNDTLISVEVALGGEFADTMRGTAGTDSLAGNGGDDWLMTLGGNDSLAGGPGADTLDGGDGVDVISYEFAGVGVTATLGLQTLVQGTDVDTVISVEGLRGSPFDDRLVGNEAPFNIFEGAQGSDTLDGGAASTMPGATSIDVVTYAGQTAVNVNLATGTARQGTDTDVLVGIEAVFGSSAADTVRGADGLANLRGETLRGAGGDDTMDGGTGVDSAEWLGPRSDYTVTRINATSWTVRDNNAANGDEGTDTVTGIERFVFADQMLSFGTRAEELARVAMVLWGQGIIGSPTLFARGYSFYGVGYTFEEMSQVALQFWTQLSDTQLAQQLIDNSGASRTVQQLLATMAANGGDVAGRAAAVREIANDVAALAMVDTVGVKSSGVVSVHEVPGFGTLFELLPG